VVEGKLLGHEIAHCQPQYRIWDAIRSSAGNRSGNDEEMASFALASKTGLHPDSRDTPRIITKQKIIPLKSGVLFKHFAWREL
jgi:hypothetical protein